MYVKSFCKHDTVLNTRSAEDAEAVKTESLPRAEPRSLHVARAECL